MPTDTASIATGNGSSRIGPKALEYLNERGIGEQTLSRWPVKSGLVPFAEGKLGAVIFDYTKSGEPVNWKARGVASKIFTQQSGGQTRLWNLDRVLSGRMDVVYVTEGEIDALSLAECGIPDDQILAFPGGAPSGDADPLESRRYEHVLDALKEGLTKAGRFVLVGDSDEPGRRLVRDLVRLFGPAKCSTIEWPEGIKDANEALMKWGPEDTKTYIHEAQKEWPVVGLYTLDDLPEPPKLEIWEPGFPEWESKIKLAPTCLSVFTGFPGHGKTQFSQQLWFNIAHRHGIRVALLSAETAPKPHVRRNLRQFYTGQLEYRMTDEERIRADQWIREHFVFIAHPNRRPDFGWLMEMIEASAQRYGCRAAVIDPWNKLEADYDKTMSETQWIGDCLDEMLDAARGLDMHLQVLAHPAKPDSHSRKEPPNLYSIAGSAHWFNRVDQGFSIHRSKILSDDGVRHTEADFYHLKARFEELGYPCKVGLDYDLESGRYKSADYAKSRAA